MSTNVRPAAVLEVVREYRGALIAREDQATAALIADHGRLQRRLAARADRLRDRIEAAQRAGTRVRPSWLHTEGRLVELMDQVANDVDLYAAGASSIVRGQVEEAAALGQRAAGEAVAMAAGGISPELVAATLPSEALQALQAVTSPPAPVGRILASMGGVAAAELRDTLLEGVATGENPRRIASRMMRVGDTTLARCRTVARTEALRAYRGANVAVFAAMPEVSGWVWIAAVDSRCCGACWAMHGTHHADGTDLESHPNCRCVPAPNVPGQKALVTPGAKQLKAMDQGDLERLLGRRKGAAIKSGRLQPEDLVGTRASPVWGLTRTEASYSRAVANAKARRAAGKGAKAKPGAPLQPAPKPTPVAPVEVPLDQRLRSLEADLAKATAEADRLGRAAADVGAKRFQADLTATRLQVVDPAGAAKSLALRDRLQVEELAAKAARDAAERLEDELKAAIKATRSAMLEAAAREARLNPREGAYQAPRHQGSPGEWLETPDGRAFAAKWTATEGDRGYDWKHYTWDEGGQDRALADLYRSQGMDGLPELVDADTLDAVPTPILWRGMQAHRGEDYYRDLAVGDYYAGLGIYGNGTYTAQGALGRRLADHDEARGVASGYGGGAGYGQLAAMKLRPDARVVHADELERMMTEDLAAWRATPAYQRMGELERSRLEEALFYDQGRYAAARGIDAYVLPSRTTGVTDYTVVLNRTALMLYEEDVWRSPFKDVGRSW